MRFGFAHAAGAAAMILFSGVAHAESVRITGRFAAPYRDAGMLRSVGVDRFGGRDGSQLGMAIERALSAPEDDGRAHFQLVSAFGGGRAEGVLSGGTNGGVDTSYFKRKDKRCAERDAKNKCVREEEYERDCTRRIVNFQADVRLVRTSDQRVLYSVAKPRRDEVSWCRGESAPRTVEDIFTGMIGDVAQEVRMDIQPHTETYSIRFRESTKGLPKAAEAQFKALVRQTQRDLRAACTGWTAMDGQFPNHPSIVFDLGLCAEATGDYDRALALYSRAAPLIGRGGNEATAGIDRAQRLIAARQDDAARNRRR